MPLTYAAHVATKTQKITTQKKAPKFNTFFLSVIDFKLYFEQGFLFVMFSLSHRAINPQSDSDNCIKGSDDRPFSTMIGSVLIFPLGSLFSHYLAHTVLTEFWLWITKSKVEEGNCSDVLLPLSCTLCFYYFCLFIPVYQCHAIPFHPTTCRLYHP